MNVSARGRAFRLTGSLRFTMTSVRFDAGALWSGAGAPAGAPGGADGAGVGAQAEIRRRPPISTNNGRIADICILASFALGRGLRWTRNSPLLPQRERVAKRASASQVRADLQTSRTASCGCPHPDPLP